MRPTADTVDATVHFGECCAALVVSNLGDPDGPDVTELAKQTGVPVHGYARLANIAACASIPGRFSAQQTA